jgi:hypothetical protein
MKTYKEQVASAAAGLGCRSKDLESVWNVVKTYSLPLTAKSLVYQVANAMDDLGMSPDTAMINTVASRL